METITQTLQQTQQTIVSDNVVVSSKPADLVGGGSSPPSLASTPVSDSKPSNEGAGTPASPPPKDEVKPDEVKKDEPKKEDDKKDEKKEEPKKDDPAKKDDPPPKKLYCN